MYHLRLPQARLGYNPTEPFLQGLHLHRLGHEELMTLNAPSKNSTAMFYLPMYSVVKESSTTTKLRVMFDTSAKSATGYPAFKTFVLSLAVHSADQVQTAPEWTVS